MSFPPFLSGNSKKRLTNAVSCGFMVLGHYTYRLVYITKGIFLGNNDLFIDRQDRGEGFGEGGLTFLYGYIITKNSFLKSHHHHNNGRRIWWQRQK
jgi:hypothetical protein